MVQGKDERRRAAAMQAAQWNAGVEDACDVDEQAALEQMARRLLVGDLSGRSRIRQPLRRRLLDAAAAPRQERGFAMRHKLAGARRLSTVAAMLVIVSGGLLAMAPVRSAAQELLARVGIFRVTDRVVDLYGSSTPTGPAEPTVAAPPGVPKEVASAAEAAAEVGFAAYVPGWLPEGLPLAYRTAGPTGWGTTIHTVYEEANGGRLLSLAQIRRYPGAEPFEFAVGKVPTEQVQVRAQAGFWADRVEMGHQRRPGGPTQLLPLSVLMWEEDGYTFFMAASGLSQAEMMRVAESIAK